MSGLFITFEGTEGGGKTTQIGLVAERLRKLGRPVCVLREPGGTAIGEEIRHTLKHSQQNHAMTAETELLLINASRAQLVRQIIRPALDGGQIILCDRFSDSTVAYQGYGRELDLGFVRSVIEFAVGNTKPHLTLLLRVPIDVSESRRVSREKSSAVQRDRFEDSDRSFFLRVEKGFEKIAEAEPDRVRVVDATADIGSVHERIWNLIEARLPTA